MKLKAFVNSLLLPRTGIYILLGILIMFFTFFTDNNALEIAISGIASIFIGIGVNNFTQIETHEKDLISGLKKIAIAIKILQYTKDKLSNTALLFEENISTASAKNQLRELESFIELSLDELKKDMQ